MNIINHSQPWLNLLDEQAVNDCLKSNQIAKGVKTDLYESNLGKYLGYDFTAVVDSGTRAIQFALMLLNIAPDDEVILPTYVCESVAEAILSLHAKPVFCDIGDSWFMTSETAESKITSKTKAIILVHPMGIIVNNATFLKFNIPIINDFCQCFVKTDALAFNIPENSISVYSFHATKCLTSGEGGLIAFNDVRFINKFNRLKHNKLITGLFNDMQATLGNSQLARYGRSLEIRKNIATRYFDQIHSSLTSKFALQKNNLIYFRFLLTKDGIDFTDICNKFKSRNISVRKGVDQLLHRLFGLSDSQFPNAEYTFNTTISIPIHPQVSDEEVNYIIQHTNDILR